MKRMNKGVFDVNDLEEKYKPEPAPVQQDKTDKAGLAISARAFVTAVVIILILMIAAYVATFFVGGMTYTEGETGEYVFSSTGVNPLPWWKFLLSPILVLGSSDSLTMILIIGLLLIIGGVFNALEKTGLLQYMLKKTVNKFKNKRYILLAVISLMFMALGSCVGMFEETLPLVPIVVMLCYSMGWDALTGLDASLLAVCCGFSAGVLNPFTVGVAQSIGGLAMFSAVELRLVCFVIIYALLMLFIFAHVRRIEKNPKKSIVFKEDETARAGLDEGTAFVKSKKLDKALIWFIAWLGVMIVLVVLSIPFPVLSDYVMIFIVLCYVFAGVGSSLLSGFSMKTLLKHFVKGVVAVLPAVIMILMAASVKFILSEANVMNTLLYYATQAIKKAPSSVAVLLIYAVVLVFNFFIGSGSAKAALLMPTIFPLADMLAINRQTAVLAFVFGDGFSNVIFPTNPVLLIALGLTVVSYTKWFRHTWKFQLCLLAVLCAVLMVVQTYIYPM